MKILVIEDEPAVAQTLQFLLTSYNYAVDIATDGEAGLEMTKVFDYDLIVLDIMLPKLDGLTVCRELRMQGFMSPILLLTGLGESQQKAIALDTGADDYIVKPFDTQELIARVQALLRRGSLSSQPVLTWGQLAIDPSTCKVAYEEHLLSLTRKEYAILELLLRNPKKAFTSKAILDQAWTSLESPTEDAVRVHIKGLRKKLVAVGAPKDFIKSKHGIGYQLNPLYFSSLPPQKAEQLTAPDMAALKAVNEELRTTLEQLRLAQAQLQQQHQELTVAYQTIEQERQQLQTSRHELEQRVALLTAELQHSHDYAPCGYHSLDAEGRIVEINETELTMLGYSREEVIGRKITDFYTPEGVQTFEENYPAFKKRGWVNDLEFAIIRKDGSLLPVSINATAIKDEADNFLMSRSIVLDISDRKRLEEQRQESVTALHQSEAKYKSLFNEMDEGYCIAEIIFNNLDKPVDYRILEANPRFEQLTALSLEIALSGRTIREIAPELEEHWYQIYGQVALTGNSIRFEQQAEGWNRWYDVYAFRIGEPEARQVAILFNDITQRKQAEIALSKSEEQFRLFVTASSDIIYRMSADWQEMLSLEGKDFLKNTENPRLNWLETYIPPAEQSGVWASIQEAIRTKSLFELEHLVIRQDSTIGWAFSRAVPLLNEEGEIVEWFGAARDITERKRREANLGFLTDISETCSRLSSAEEIIQNVGEKIGAYLQVVGCNFSEIDEVQDQVIYFGCWQAAGEPSLPSRICLSEQVSEEFYRRAKAGETIVSHNTQSNSVTNAEANASIGALSFITVPFHKNGEWKYLFSIHDNEPRTWREDEIQLVQELANRLFPRLERASAEVALQESEERYRYLVEITPQLLWKADTQGYNIYISSKMAEYIGLSPEELLNLGWQTAVHPDDLDRIHHRWMESVQTGSPYEAEYRLRRADGVYRWHLVRAICLHKGEEREWFGVSTDIGDSKETQAVLEQQLLREKTLAVISQDIRRSLKLNEVLSRTVNRVRELLNCDRVIIFRFLPNWRGEVIVESVGAEWTTILSTIIFDPCFGDRYIEPYRQGRIATITDIDNEDLEPCYVDLLKQFEVKANLVVPISQKENLWGLLIIHQCSAPRQWLRSDIDLLQQLATQVEIAIQQSELYEKTRQELAQRKQIQQQLQTIVDNSPTAIYLLDPQNRHLLVNSAYAEVLSTTPENILGKSIYEVWPANIATTFDFNNQQVLETGQLLQTEEIAPLADGLHTYITVKFPLCDAGGKPYAICGISTDITERQKAEQKIREQAALIDIASDAIFVHDLDNRIVFWNQGAERMYGWTVSEALGKNAQELFKEEKITELREGLQKVLVKGLWQTELTQTTKAGNKIIVASRWNLMRDSSGQPQSILVVNSDITEKKQLESQFYHAQRLESLGTLASGIAHDLNNVLTPILAISQLLPRKFPDLDERTRQLLATLESSARRGAEMVKPILAFARGNGGQHTPLQIAYLLSEVVHIASRTFTKEIEISADLPERELWLISGDATQLHQVFMNLMVNARDAMPLGGCLTIEARNFLVDENYARLNLEAKVGPYVAVMVADTGTGFSPEEKERIFDPFFTTKEVGKGTGLGLSTVLGIVKNHGGFIQVSSEIGKGSQFTVYLPAIRENAKISKVAKEMELLRGKGEVILVVDDEPAVRETTQSSLEEYNYRVILASDGIEALSIYAQYQDQINVILMDIMMPNLDGITTIRTLKKMNPNVKIITMSGLSSQKETALAAGASGFLPKPYTAESLLMSLFEMINSIN